MGATGWQGAQTDAAVLQWVLVLRASSESLLGTEALYFPGSWQMRVGRAYIGLLRHFKDRINHDVNTWPYGRFLKILIMYMFLVCTSSITVNLTFSD